MVIEETWIHLDTASTERVTNNELLVTDVRQCLADYVLAVMTNYGSQVFEKSGILVFLTLRVNVKIYSVATILSLKYVSNIIFLECV